ncbi:hypothetical protein Tco_1008049 [Tanacetum coccineum]
MYWSKKEWPLKTPIKPPSPDNFRMKEVDHLTIHTPPSPHVASFHPKDTYCYYNLCIDDPKKHYGFKPGLLGQGGSLGDDFSKMEMIENDWELESKEVSFLGRGLNLPVWPKEVEKVEKTYLLEDKQILTLGWHLEEIHVTWAHLEKKRTRLRTYTKIHQELCSQSVETASQALSDAVMTYLVTVSGYW